MLRTIGFITLIALLTLGIGFITGWFNFQSETHAGETELRLSVDHNEVNQDLSDVERAARRTADAAKRAITPAHQAGDGLASMAAPSVFNAKVVAVAPTESTVTLELGSGEVRTYAVAVDSTSDFHRARIGDAVEVTLTVVDGNARVIGLRVLAGS